MGKTVTKIAFFVSMYFLQVISWFHLCLLTCCLKYYFQPVLVFQALFTVLNKSIRLSASGQASEAAAQQQQEAARAVSESYINQVQLFVFFSCLDLDSNELLFPLPSNPCFQIVEMQRQQQQQQQSQEQQQQQQALPGSGRSERTAAKR